MSHSATIALVAGSIVTSLPDGATKLSEVFTPTKIMPSSNTAVVGSPPTSMLPSACGARGSVMSTRPIAPRGLSVYTSVMPSSLTLMISALVSRAISSPSAMLDGVGNAAIRLNTGSASAGTAAVRAMTDVSPRVFIRMSEILCRKSACKLWQSRMTQR